VWVTLGGTRSRLTVYIYSYIKFHKNPFSGGQIVPRKQKGQTMSLCANFANMRKKELYLKKSVPWSCRYRAVGWSTLGATTWAVRRALVDLMCNNGIN